MELSIFVFFNMVVEVALGSKRPIAALLSTSIGFFTRMNSEMSLEISFLIEGFLALSVRTYVFLYARMRVKVDQESCFSIECSIAACISAFEFFNILVKL